VKSGRVTHSKSLKVYSERYHPTSSVVLNAANVPQQGARTLAPLYTAGLLARRCRERE
jgi:hypothetical protein